LELFGDFLFAKNHNLSFLNAQPLSNGTGVVVPAGRVGTNNDVSSPGYVPGVTNTIYNPFSVQIDQNFTDGLFAENRFQSHPREFEDDSTFYRVLGGIRSQISSNWNVESAAYYSKYNIAYNNGGLVNADQLNAAIAGTATDNAGNPIPALDFFARNPIGTGPGQLSAAQFSTIFGSNIRTLESYQEVFDAKVYGFPVHLPGGDLGVSFGGEYREEGFKLSDSPEIFVGSVPVGEINVGRYIESAYAEISLPIIGPDMKVPGIYSLEADAAYRHDTYEGLSEGADVPKFTLRYQPIQDLTLRATYSNSFVAPTLYELFGPVSTGFSTGITLNGQAQDQAQVETGSNPNLVPATAESYTAGIVYSPHFVPGLTLSADYFRTLYQGIVSTLGGPTILGSVNSLGTASPYANLVAFNNFPGQSGARPVTGPNQLAGHLAQVYYLDTSINIGALHLGGFDFSANYNLDLRQWGQAEFGLSAVWFTTAEQKTTPQSDYYNISDVDFAEGGGALPDYKLTGLARYSIAGASLAINANYTPGLINGQGHDVETEDQGTFQKVGDFLQFDGRLSYDFKARPVAPPPAATGYSKDAKDGKGMVAGVGTTAAPESFSPFSRLIDGLSVAVGCNNIFDRQPPLIEGADNNTDLSLYDPYGRFVYFEISKKF
jgi:iron complex outermembrane receptor protein